LGSERRIEVSWLLIADENELFRKVFRSSLRQHLDSIDIKEAGSAEKALAEISESPPVLVFLDIHLPGGEGLKLISKIKCLFPKTRVAVCTTLDTDEYRRAAHRLGADYFVSKSAIKIKDMVTLIRSHMKQPKGNFIAD
jgi:DNA-binding NarL/FixJ family response regulator